MLLPQVFDLFCLLSEKLGHHQFVVIVPFVLRFESVRCGRMARRLVPRRIVPRHLVPRRLVPRRLLPRRLLPRRLLPRHILPRRLLPRRLLPRRLLRGSCLRGLLCGRVLTRKVLLVFSRCHGRCCRRCRSRLLPLLLLRYCSHCRGDLALLLLGSRDRRGDMLPLLLLRRRRRCHRRVLLLTRKFVLCSEELLLRELLLRRLQVCRSKVRLWGQHMLRSKHRCHVARRARWISWLEVHPWRTLTRWHWHSRWECLRARPGLRDIR